MLINAQKKVTQKRTDQDSEAEAGKPRWGTHSHADISACPPPRYGGCQHIQLAALLG